MQTNNTVWNADGECTVHGLTAERQGNCECCEMGLPAPEAEPLTGIAKTWAESTTRRMAPGGDLYSPVRWAGYRAGLSEARRKTFNARGK